MVGVPSGLAASFELIAAVLGLRLIIGFCSTLKPEEPSVVGEDLRGGVLSNPDPLRIKLFPKSYFCGFTSTNSFCNFSFLLGEEDEDVFGGYRFEWTGDRLSLAADF